MRKVVITGPESSGKTALAVALARATRANSVTEVAREYLEKLGRSYQEEDLLEIAKAQLAAEAITEAEAGINELLICDTDLITIRIWSEEKYGRCDPWIIGQTERRPYDLWLLCRPDIPWETDPLRENPRDRDRLFTRHEELMRSLTKPFVIIEGDREQRLILAVDAVRRMMDREVRSSFSSGPR